MKIGVLETGPVLGELAEAYGPYTEFFRRMLTSVDDTIEVEGWETYQNKIPDHPQARDGWVISGSKFGVYEDHSFIPPLEDFLRECLDARVPIAGFCFGHQILAQAAGGMVEKSHKGWGLGVHHYETLHKTDWMDPGLDRFSCVAIHQDQVVAKPDNTTVIARSEFCENAVLAYGDPDKPIAISIQPHPEFNTDFAKDLIRARRGISFPKDRSDVALDHIGDALNNVEWSKSVVSFFRRALENKTRQS